MNTQYPQSSPQQNNAVTSHMPITNLSQQNNVSEQIGEKRKSKAITATKRLANTKGLTREEWLNLRKQGIGASDAAAACGLNPYMSMLELWMIKTGRMQIQPDQPQQKSYSPLYWGVKLEPLIAGYYQDKTGHKVRRVNAVLQHAEYDFMLANLDYSIVGCDEVQILECKSVGEWGTKQWRDGVPLYILIQVQHQLAVTGKQAAHICVLICGHDAKIFKVERNEKVIDRIIASERIFWSCVQNDVPPSVDATESAARALQLLYPEHVPLEEVDFSNLESIDQLFTDLIQESKYLADHQSKYDFLKHRIQSLMKNAEKAIFSLGTVTWKKSKDSIVLDQKAVLKDQPQLLDQYPQTKMGSRRFNIHLN